MWVQNTFRCKSGDQTLREADHTAKFQAVLPKNVIMVLHNPNNWHWVNKDVREWAKDYLVESLVGISAKEGDVVARVSKIVSMDGDVDVCQRKGKVITLFDIKLQMGWEGNGEPDLSSEISIDVL